MRHNKKQIGRILQCGFPKSGNYLLWKILQVCQAEEGIYTSFSKKSGITKLYEGIYALLGLGKYFKEALEIDEIEPNENGELKFFKLMITGNPFFCGHLDTDTALLTSVSSLLWTHSLPEEVAGNGFLKDRLRIYIIRDGRAVVNSLIHHNVRQETLKFMPFYKYTRVDEIYNDEWLFRRYVEKWKKHVYSYLNTKEKFMLVRFESLTDENKQDLKSILSLFGLENRLKEFSEKFSFNSMKKNSGTHLRKGRNDDWKNHFTGKHKDIFKEIAGELLIKLGYETDYEW